MCVRVLTLCPALSLPLTYDCSLIRVARDQFREFMSDFGPLVVIIGMSFFCSLPSWSGLLSFLEVSRGLVGPWRVRAFHCAHSSTTR